MAISNEQKARLLDTLDGSFVSLHLGDPGETGAHELTGSGYARQPAKLTPAAEGVKSLASDAKFDNLRGCEVSYFGLFSSKSGGSFLMGGKLLEPVTLRAGDGFRFPAGSISFGAR